MHQRRAQFTSVRGRTPLLGRAAEVEFAQGLLEDAIAGVPRVLIVTGEPGIGKSRLLREIRTMARGEQFEIGAGRAFDQVALPYAPVTSALEPLLRGLDEREASGFGGVLARLRGTAPPETDAMAAGFTARTSTERSRLFDGATELLLRAASRRPTLLTLDDLHWADAASLDLLAHVVVALSARCESEAVPLLIVCAHRTLVADDPAAATLARVRREDVAVEMHLGGLDESAIADMLRALGNDRATGALLRQIADLTLGNPLLIEEVLHQLRKSGRAGVLPADVAALDGALPLPLDVRAALAGRVLDFDARSRELLTVAACIGDQFDVDDLARASGRDASDVRDVVHAAERARVLTSDGDACAFSHPLIRHALTDTIDPAARAELHRRIADALESRANNDDAVLAIASHLTAARTLVEPARLLDVARRAGDHAMAVCAWTEATRFFDAAIGALDDVPGVTEADRAAVHHRLALACARSLDADRACAEYRIASRSYEAVDDRRGVLVSEIELTRMFVTLASVAYGSMVDVARLEWAMDRAGAAEEILRGHALAVLCQVHWTARNPEEAIACGRRALAIADTTGDARLGCEAATALALALGQTLELEEAEAIHRRAIAFGHSANDSWLETYGVHRLPLTLTWRGKLDEADALARRSPEYTRRSQEWAGASMALAARITVAVIRGRFAEAASLGDQVKLLVERSGYPWGGYNALPAVASGSYLRGDATEAERILDRVVEPGVLFREPGTTIQLAVWTFRQLVGARAGVNAEQRQQLLGVLGSIAPPDRIEIGAVPSFCALGEIACRLDAPEASEAAFRAVSYAWSRGVTFTSAWVFLVPRVLGMLLALRGDTAGASAMLQTAAKIATDVGAHPEIALTRLAQARLLVSRGDAEAAREMAGRALESFEALGMTPSVREASTLLAALRDRSSDAHAATRKPAADRSDGDEALADDRDAPGCLLATLEEASLPRLASGGAARPARREARAFPLVTLVTDMVDSTALLRRLGERATQELMREHNDLVRACFREFGCREVKFTGDGFLATHASAMRALQCAVAIQDAAARRGTGASVPIRMRVALDAGEVLIDDRDLIGSAVNAANRLCAEASPGQIVVSPAVVALADDDAFTFVALGERVLKGFEEPMAIYAVRAPARDGARVEPT